MLKVLCGKAGSDYGDRTRMTLPEGHFTGEILNMAPARWVL
jgi:hypothetical protein